MKARTKLIWKQVIIAATISIGVFTVLYFSLDTLFDGWFDDQVRILMERYLYDNLNLKNELLILGAGSFALLTILVCAIVIIATDRRSRREIDRLLPSVRAIAEMDDSLIELPEEYKDVENQLNAIKNTAIKNERLAREAEQRKNDLVVYLAHDLKTPLTSVVGYLTLLRDEPDISPEMRQKYTNISLEKARRLEALINEFFDITRFNLQNITLEKTQFDLVLMLQQIVDEFYPAFSQKGITCHISADDRLMIEADADKLSRVFDNLLKNALSYGEPYTGLTVSIHQQGGRAVVEVANHCPQIPEHKLSSIFERFYRLDSARSANTGGSGLGLAIAKEITELHGGVISAESSPSLTVFRVELPL